MLRRIDFVVVDQRANQKHPKAAPAIGFKVLLFDVLR
jgi:hypothetical protein